MRFAKYIPGLVVVFLLTAFTVQHKYRKPGEPGGTIEIHDNQYACYNSTEYYLILVDSSLVIDNYSEHGDMNDTNYNPDDLLNEKLSKEDMLRAQDFMASFPWDSLEDKYESGKKKECDSTREINIIVRDNNLRKDIQIKDCYSKNMARVFNFINSLIPKNKRDSLQIDYTAKEFTCRKKD